MKNLIPVFTSTGILGLWDSTKQCEETLYSLKGKRASLISLEENVIKLEFTNSLVSPGCLQYWGSHSKRESDTEFNIGVPDVSSCTGKGHALVST